MFTITKPSVVAGNGLVHFATSRQIASDPSFDTDYILIDDEKNEVDLLTITIDLPLTTADKYYVRDKLHFKDEDDNEKETDWSKAIVVTKNIDGFTINDTIINTPKLDVLFNKKDAPLGGFNITTDKYMLFKGIGTHKYTDWLIEDLFGTVVWKRTKDGYNLNSIRVPECILEKNKTYIIKSRFISSTNKSSNYGKLTICTNDYYMDISCVDGSDTTISVSDSLSLLVANTIYYTL